jgi:hypothetical protein
MVDLPPRRTLPPEVRDRIRRTALAPAAPPPWTVRYRAPLSVAAGVAVLAVAAIVIGQSVAGTPDGFRVGTTPPDSSRLAPLASGVDPTPIPPDTRAVEDLDHCATVAAASPRAHEFAPRAEWTPVLTAVQGNVRLVAFHDGDGKPGFCEIDGNTATLSDPSAEPMRLATASAGSAPADIYALYLSRTGLMAGVGQGVNQVNYNVTPLKPLGVAHIASIEEDDLFVLQLDELAPGDTVEFSGYDAAGNETARGTWTYDPAKVRPVGATGTF